MHYQTSLDLEVSIVFINGSLNLQNSQNKTLDVMMSCTTILPDTEVGVFRLYQPSTYDKFYTRVYGETESRISLDVMLDVEIEHHIISISLTPRAIYTCLPSVHTVCTSRDIL